MGDEPAKLCCNCTAKKQVIGPWIMCDGKMGIDTITGYKDGHWLNVVFLNKDNDCKYYGPKPATVVTSPFDILRRCWRWVTRGG